MRLPVYPGVSWSRSKGHPRHWRTYWELSGCWVEVALVTGSQRSQVMSSSSVTKYGERLQLGNQIRIQHFQQIRLFFYAISTCIDHSSFLSFIRHCYEAIIKQWHVKTQNPLFLISEIFSKFGIIFTLIFTEIKLVMRCRVFHI